MVFCANQLYTIFFQYKIVTFSLLIHSFHYFWARQFWRSYNIWNHQNRSGQLSQHSAMACCWHAKSHTDHISSAPRWIHIFNTTVAYKSLWQDSISASFRHPSNTGSYWDKKIETFFTPTKANCNGVLLSACFLLATGIFAFSWQSLHGTSLQTVFNRNFCSTENE